MESKFAVDRYGRKIQTGDETRLVEPRKTATIAELWAADQKRTAQKKDNVDDKREDLVVDAGDDLSAFEKAKDKNKSDAQDPDVIFNLSSGANTDKGKFDSDKKGTEKDDVKGDLKKSTDERGDYVSETKADDVSAYESAKNKAQKGGTASLVKAVKERWAKTVHSVLFDPFQLNGKKSAVGFKIGNDYILMPSKKPTRTEWLTAQSVVAELRDPSILRSAQYAIEDIDKLSPMDGAGSPMPEDEKVKTDANVVTSINEMNDIPEDFVEEKDEAACLKSILDLLNDGKIDDAKAELEDCIAEEEEELEGEKGDGEGKKEQFQGGDEKEEKTEEKTAEAKKVVKADDSKTKLVNKAEEDLKAAKEIGSKSKPATVSGKEGLKRGPYSKEERDVKLD